MLLIQNVISITKNCIPTNLLQDYFLLGYNTSDTEILADRKLKTNLKRWQ